MRKTLAAGITAGAIAAFGLAAPAYAISDTTADLSVLAALSASFAIRRWLRA